ncbi:MAG: hypothetical protein AB7V50_04085 [Vampirovibrionia bacterium]
MSTMMNMASLHQHQLNLMKQADKYNSSIAEYNLNKLIRYYKSAINSAETSSEAKGLADSLQSLLQNQGKSLSDVDGLNTNLLNGTDANGKAAGAHGQKGSAYDKAIIKDLSDEFGIDVKKSGTTKDWLQKAKTDKNVRILDKNGKDITAEREGRIKKGDILEVNSKKHGLVKISVGGDGEINGRDDKVISVGGKAAANSMEQGLNQINQQPQTNNNYNNTNTQTNPINTINPFGNTENTQALNNNNLYNNFNFTDDQIKNLIAAILNQSLFNINEKENENYLKMLKAS